MACERLEFPVFSFPSASRDMPPDRELAAARALVDDWLGMAFLHRADAVEDLVVRIAAALGGRRAEGRGRAIRAGFVIRACWGALMCVTSDAEISV